MISMGNSFHCITTFVGVKKNKKNHQKNPHNFLLVSNLNLPSFSLKPLLSVLSLQVVVKRLCLSYKLPLYREQGGTIN